MATASTSQHCTDKGGGVGEYSFGHLRFYFIYFFQIWKKMRLSFQMRKKKKWTLLTQCAGPNLNLYVCCF